MQGVGNYGYNLQIGRLKSGTNLNNNKLRGKRYVNN